MIKYFFFFSLLLFNFYLFSKANDSPKLDEKKISEKNWENWKIKIKKNLKNSELKVSTINHIDDLLFQKKVILLDRKQPEFKLSFNEYIQKVTPKKIINKGKEKLEKNTVLLTSIEKDFTIPRSLIVSLWGIETHFGKHTGNFDVLNSLATLSYEGRRAKFFYKEFVNALQIIDNEFIDRRNLKGSWAGAIGQTQFMPSTFINYAIDFDSDGKKNLLNSKADALASGANYLKKIGWEIDKNWGEEVKLNLQENPIFTKLSNDKSSRKKSYWLKKGVKFKKNYATNQMFRLIIPDQKSNRFFLVTENFDIILNWNRSNYFALAVNLLSDKINEKN